MKNPFSIYDFLGYLFPGILFVLMLLEVFTDKDILSIESLLDSEQKVKLSLDSYFLFVIISYVAGHIVAYVSSLLVEDFANRIFGYPSKYLLHKEKATIKDMWMQYFGTSASTGNNFTKRIIKWAKIGLKGIIFLLLLPVTLSVFTIGYLFEVSSKNLYL